MLNDLLAKVQQYSPIYYSPNNKLFCNHIPMTLIALDNIAATDDTLNSFYQAHKDLCIYLPPQEAIITKENWSKYLGQHHYYPNYYDYFKEQLTLLGRDALLRYYLSRLQLGLTSHANHPMIRIAYALIANNDSEVVAGLAYLASLYQPQQLENDNLQNKSDTQTIFKRLQAENWSHIKIGGTIEERLWSIYSDKKFQQVISAHPIDTIDLPQLAKTALAIYLEQADIVTLHFVTGCHALRLISPYINNVQIAYKTFWQMLCAAYVSIGCLEFATTNHTTKSSSWDAIFKSLQQSKNDHDIKLAFTCYQEYQHYQDENYLLIAEKIARI